MTRMFDVINLSDELAVVVDKDAEIEVGDTVYTYGGRVGIYEYDSVSYTHDIVSEGECYPLSTKDYIFKVVGSVGKRIEGLPLVQVEKKDEEEKIRKEAERYTLDKFGEIDDFIDATKGFIDGYKAAQQKGTYTKWDIENAFIKGCFTDLYHNDRSRSDTDYAEEKAKEYVKSLYKKQLPVRVELEERTVRDYNMPDKTPFMMGDWRNVLKTIPSKEGEVVIPVNIYFS